MYVSYVSHIYHISDFVSHQLVSETFYLLPISSHRCTTSSSSSKKCHIFSFFLSTFQLYTLFSHQCTAVQQQDQHHGKYFQSLFCMPGYFGKFFMILSFSSSSPVQHQQRQKCLFFLTHFCMGTSWNFSVSPDTFLKVLDDLSAGAAREMCHIFSANKFLTKRQNILASITFFIQCYISLNSWFNKNKRHTMKLSVTYIFCDR